MYKFFKVITSDLQVIFVNKDYLDFLNGFFFPISSSGEHLLVLYV